MVRVHASGLLGFTGVGWLLAAGLNGVELWQAIRHRDALLVLQSAQAVIFQLVSGLALGGLLAVVFAGFLLLGGSSELLPELPVVDPFSLGGAVVLVLWLISILSLPVCYAWTLRQAVRAWRRSAVGELYAYPFVGSLVWAEAPRLLRWIVLEGEGDARAARDDAPEEPQKPIESAP